MGNRKIKPVKSIAINMWAPVWDTDTITKLDAEDVAEHCLDAGAEVLFLWQGWSQDHFGEAYYPTRKGPRHPNLAPGRDHMAEIVKACHDCGIKVVAYYSFVDKVVWDREADWRQVGPDGNAYEPKAGGGGTGRFGALCPNSPYREYVIARQTEILEKYDIDGTSLLDSAHFSGTGCYCKYCRKKYKLRYGRNIPEYSGEWTAEWERYTKWKADCMKELFDDMRAAHRKLRPDFPISELAFGCRGDFEGFVGWDFERMTGEDDFVNSITQWQQGLADGTVNRNPGNRWTASMNTNYLRAVSRDKEVYLHLGRFTYDREYQNMPVNELEGAIDSIVAAGGNPSVADNLFPDGSIDEQAYINIKEIFDRLDRKNDFLSYDKEVHYAGLFYSKPSVDYCGAVYSDNRFFNAVQGAYKFLIEHHYPVKFVCNQDLTPEYLKQFSVFILPETLVLKDSEIEVISEYVKDGGCLISAGPIGLVGEHAEIRDNFGLSEVIGADYRYPSEYSFHYYDLGDRKTFGSTCDKGLMIFRGEQCVVKARKDAETEAVIVLPATERDGDRRAVTFAMDMHPGKGTDFPGIITNSFGKGKSVWFAGDVFEVYGVYGYPGIRKVLLDAMHFLDDGSRAYEVKAPRCVETTGYYKDSELRIHLVNYAYDGISIINAEGGIMAEDPLPVCGIQVELACSPEEIREIRYSSGKEAVYAGFEKNGKMYTRVTLPALETYEILAVNMKNS